VVEKKRKEKKNFTFVLAFGRSIGVKKKRRKNNL
jgi:hypothetical protein